MPQVALVRLDFDIRCAASRQAGAICHRTTAHRVAFSIGAVLTGCLYIVPLFSTRISKEILPNLLGPLFAGLRVLEFGHAGRTRPVEP
jgi:hypothetical protein